MESGQELGSEAIAAAAGAGECPEGNSGTAGKWRGYVWTGLYSPDFLLLECEFVNAKNI